MHTLGEIYDMLDSWAPFATQLSYDNAGLLIGSREREVHKVGTALDVTPETLADAMEKGCGLIVTHHPVIFRPLRAVPEESLVFRLIKAGIALLSAHTNLDAADGGVNDLLAARLELEQVEKLADPKESAYPAGARIGRLRQPMTADELAAFVKEKLGAGGVRYTRREGRIQRVAVCGGAGADDFMDPAMAAGAEALVTGEAKHHQWLEAKERNFTLLDGSHFSTEQLVADELAARLSAAFPDLEVCRLRESEPVRYL